ncbi:BLUF domain-containing protein [Sphingomonas sp. OK281]|uniref:BLUF domain-containing protein n=1 Tax=Sphingomonas sp. OK281 TaxID=1881067 RepID=UPI0008F1BE4D|nr:BLUF domain-containing protein [Sphingomonas sp. OK281]SFO10609.1 Sensors of blue-light using FAD [Sphingomonas sp. OK281]
MLRRIIYISKSRMGPDPSGIAAIVSSSISRNAKTDVTGMLWADGHHFAQVLEGDPSAVEQTMGRIRTDLRHADIEVLFDRQVSSRQFGQWSMRRAADDEESARGSAFIIGFALNIPTAPAQRLYQIVLASDEQGK